MQLLRAIIIVFGCIVTKARGSFSSLVFLNSVRMFPNDMAFIFDIDYGCDVSENSFFLPFIISDGLSDAADAKVSEFSDNRCTDSWEHDTCEPYCHLYASCRWEDRIRFYIADKLNSITNGTVHLAESLGYNYPTALETMKSYLASPTHCSIMMSPLYDTVGYATGLEHNCVTYMGYSGRGYDYTEDYRIHDSALIHYGNRSYYLSLFEDSDPGVSAYESRVHLHNPLGDLFIYVL